MDVLKWTLPHWHRTVAMAMEFREGGRKCEVRRVVCSIQTRFLEAKVFTPLAMSLLSFCFSTEQAVGDVISGHLPQALKFHNIITL